MASLGYQPVLFEVQEDEVAEPSVPLDQIFLVNLQ